MVADLPENYAMYPEAFEFIRRVPVDWATTRVLDAAIGDFVVTARKDRASEDWYVGGISDGEARAVSFSFDFLDTKRSYVATIYRDAERAAWDSYPTDHVIEQREVCANDNIEIGMAAGGGFAMIIEPK